MSKIKFTAKVNQENIEIPQEYQEAIQKAETIEIIINRQTISSNRGIFIACSITLSKFKTVSL